VCWSRLAATPDPIVHNSTASWKNRHALKGQCHKMNGACKKNMIWVLVKIWAASKRIGEECRTGRLCINNFKVYAVSLINYCLTGSLLHIHSNTATPVFPLFSYHQLRHTQSHTMIIQVSFPDTLLSNGLLLAGSGRVLFRQHKERRPFEWQLPSPL
jgi:hypothetical protein